MFLRYFWRQIAADADAGSRRFQTCGCVVSKGDHRNSRIVWWHSPLSNATKGCQENLCLNTAVSNTHCHELGNNPHFGVTKSQETMRCGWDMWYFENIKVTK